jgi:predicted transcriptional regulator
MTDTTIAVDDDVKAKIESLQYEYETFNQTLSRLADAYEDDGKKWTQEEIQRIVDERLQEQVRR